MFSPLKIKLVFFAAVLLLLDICFAPVIEISGARPIFSFLIVAYAGFQWNIRRIVPLAVGVGLARDILGGGILGVEMFALTSAAFALDWIVHKIEKEFPGIYFLLTFIFCFSVLLCEFLMDAALGKIGFNIEGHFKVIFFGAFYTGLFLPLFYQISDFFFKPHTELRQYELFRD